MKIKIGLMLMIAMLVLSTQGYADIDQAVVTMTEGAVEFPVGLVKLVGGLVWTVGEAIALPFRMIF